MATTLSASIAGSSRVASASIRPSNAPNRHSRAVCRPTAFLSGTRLSAHRAPSATLSATPARRSAIRAQSADSSPPPSPTEPAASSDIQTSPSSPGFGLGGPGTWFGFGTRQELNVGRLAMVGFASALIMEVLTGEGIFGQLGINAVTIRFPFLAGIAFLLVGGLLGGWVVINNPPDVSKAPPNAGAGVPRNPFDKKSLDPLVTYTRGVQVETEDGKAVILPIASDLKPLDK